MTLAFQLISIALAKVRKNSFLSIKIIKSEKDGLTSEQSMKFVASDVDQLYISDLSCLPLPGQWC